MLWETIVNEVTSHLCESPAKIIDEFADRLVEIAVLLGESLDLIDRVHHCRVMLASELAADLWKTTLGQTFAEIHCNLPGYGDGPRFILLLQLLYRHSVMRSDSAGNTIDSKTFGTLGIDDIFHRVLCEHLRNRNAS